MPTGRIVDAESAWHTSLQEFGEQLRHKREHVLRLSQTQMAARVGLDQSRISRIEAGGKPRDKATAVALAEAYRLTPTETKAWMELLFGSTTLYANGHSPDNLTLEDVYTLLEQWRGDVISGYNYFNSDRFAPSDEQAIAVVDWLLAAGGRRPRAHLLVEFAAVLMHHLNERGQHQRRLALALAAADAARELERRTVEGWLRSDAIPWTLMEHRHDPTAARPHLERGLALARELKNRDMEALSLAFLAKSEMTGGDNRHAGNHLARARSLNPSPPVQTRIDWIGGDLALRQKRYDKALTLYRAAEVVDNNPTNGHHAVTPLLRQGELFIRLGDLSAAKESYTTLLTAMHPPLAGGRLARTLFGLARVARLEGEIERTYQLAERARAALSTADDDPQFRQIIALFVAALPE